MNEEYTFGHPLDSKKFHVFDKDGRSLCLKWLYFGHHGEPVTDPPGQMEKTAGDCSECVKRYNAKRGK